MCKLILNSIGLFLKTQNQNFLKDFITRLDFVVEKSTRVHFSAV